MVAAGPSLTAVMLIVAVSLASQVAAAGIAVVIDRERQRRAGRRIVGAVGVADGRRAIGGEQRIDLRNRAGDGHRTGAAIRHNCAAAACRHRERAFGHRQGDGHAARIGVAVADRQALGLQVERGLLGRVEAGRRDDRGRAVVDRRDADRNGLGVGRAGAVIDRDVDRAGGQIRINVVEIGIDQMLDQDADQSRRGVAVEGDDQRFSAEARPARRDRADIHTVDADHAADVGVVRQRHDADLGGNADDVLGADDIGDGGGQVAAVKIRAVVVRDGRSRPLVEGNEHAAFGEGRRCRRRGWRSPADRRD